MSGLLIGYSWVSTVEQDLVIAGGGGAVTAGGYTASVINSGQ